MNRIFYDIDTLRYTKKESILTLITSFEKQL